MKLKIKFKKLNKDAVIPLKAHSTDAGMDLTSIGITHDITGALTYHTGLAVEIPPGYMGLLVPRSSVYKKDMFLTNHAGIIDSDYRGEIMAKFKPIPHNPLRSDVKESQRYAVGDRFAQLVIVPIPEIEIEEVKELSESERGTGGYGSTGT